MKAVVLPEVNGEMSVKEIADPKPKQGEVKIAISACGVCHTDLHVIKGEVAFPTPAVLGHEISGTVVEVGENVHNVAVGDKVVSAFIMPCGECRHCVRGWEDLCENFFKYNRLNGQLYDGTTRLYEENGDPIAMYSMGGLAEYSIVPASDVFKLPAGVDEHKAAILGCSVFTSYGAVKNTAELKVGETVAVVAVGGIGLNIIQVAAAFGAKQIIAVDISDEKLALAKKLGATHTINSLNEDASARVRELTDGRGVDVAFEALGSQPTVDTAVTLVDDGGRVVLVGIAPAGVNANLPIAHVVRRKIKVLGSYGARARTDMPGVLDLVASGKLNLDSLVTDEFDLDHAAEAYKLLNERKIIGRAIVKVS